MKKAFWLAGATVLALAQPASAGDTIKIGFVSTFSGPTAVIGNDMRNSFELALDHGAVGILGAPVRDIHVKPDEVVARPAVRVPGCVRGQHDAVSARTAGGVVAAQLRATVNV